jgi:DNA replication ATP-dependent helicase Dna2
MIISLVRSYDEQNVGELLRDWRRINVAFTRAKTKLLVLGSRTTLISNELLKKFVELMERNNWVYDLPVDAQAGHIMPIFMTQKQKQKLLSENGRKQVRGSTKIINGKKAMAARRDFLGNRPVLRDIVNEVA